MSLLSTINSTIDKFLIETLASALTKRFNEHNINEYKIFLKQFLINESTTELPIVTQDAEIQVNMLEDKKEQLYNVNWSCPVCMDDLGIDKGVVPCVITTCRPVAHTICFKCIDRLSTIAGTDVKQCPICRKECGNILPIGAFISEKDDSEACAIMDSVQFKGDPSRLEAIIDRSRSEAAKLTDKHMEYIQKRVMHIVEQVTGHIESGTVEKYHGSMCGWTNGVPDFDQGIIRIRCSKHESFSKCTTIELEHSLHQTAFELQPHIDAIFEGSSYKITMYPDQFIQKNIIKQFVYLRYNIETSKL